MTAEADREHLRNMGKRDAPELWAICRDCGNTGNVTRTPPKARLVCSRCGGRDYSLTVNDPARPWQSNMKADGPWGADIRLPPVPEIDPAAWERGEYP